MLPTESPSDLPNKFADFFLKKKEKKSKNSFMTQIHINHSIGNVQNSLALFLWKKINYSASSKKLTQQPVSWIPAIPDFY